MEEEAEVILLEAEERMERTVANLQGELQQVRTGRAHPGLLEGIKVEYYGAMTPLNQLANVSAPEPRMLMVAPFDPSTCKMIEDAIMMSNLGLNPNNADGKLIRVPIPELSEERRKEMVKHTRRLGEEAKVAVRNIRRDTNDRLKKLDGLSEDLVKDWLENTQKLTDTQVVKVDSLITEKEQDLMKV